MTTVTVSVTTEVEEFLRTVAQARGVTEAEFLQDELKEAAVRYLALKSEIQKGIDSLEREGGIPGEEVFARIRQRASELNR